MISDTATISCWRPAATARTRQEVELNPPQKNPSDATMAKKENNLEDVAEGSITRLNQQGARKGWCVCRREGGVWTPSQRVLMAARQVASPSSD